MKKIMIILFSVLALNAWAQKETVVIITSASCFEGPCCKERIEEEMQFTRGVTAVDFDINSQALTVKFKTKRTDANKLREVISLLGYNADDVKANKKAHDNLPSCCQHLEFNEGG
ncbi:MAG: hypothetical protein CMD16_04105 [Flavobacteriales bacterium]|nr:hypothetical protein [Flavobacteriales bacterium]|tara:strand:- start:14747 stop:15091 length:345 start_codon:yes stop_codon:yes gene_type:complete